MKSYRALIPLGVIAVLLVVGWFHRYWLFDGYRIATFTRAPVIDELIERSGMSGHGERLFLGGQPQVLPEEEFDQYCQFAELGLVLGCYRSADIFILDVTEKQLEAVEPVTAAHEMLHVHYGRMTEAEEADMILLLDKQYALVENQRIIDEIEGYKDDPDSDIYNEMHSIFGTELDELIPELEQHYAQFFSDRSKVLAESASYEDVFIALESEIEQYDNQLNLLNEDIQELEARATQLSGEIETQRNELDQLEALDEIEAYNAKVPAFNQLVNTYNQTVTTLKAKINEYNAIVAQRNENVAAKNNLIKSLNSDVETIQPQ